MRHDRLAPSTARRLGCVAAMLVCVLLLGGCRFGAPVSFFDENGGTAQAVDSIRQRLNAPVRVLDIAIEPARVTLRVQDAKSRNRVEEWRLERVAMVGANWDRVSGPHPYEPTLVNPDLEANLFELEELDFTATARLALAAVERAALAGKAEVARIEIARPVFVVPSLASGEVRWTFDVRGNGESVQVFVDTQGTIVGMNLDGTARAKTLDLLRELDLVAEAARTFRFVLGRDAILTAVSVGPRAVTFETSVADSSGSASPAGAAARRLYSWNLNGLQRTAAQTSLDPAVVRTRGRFSIDDADWSVLPRLAAAALAQLAMPQGRVTGIELTRPAAPAGSAAVLWRIEVTEQDKKGVVLADAAGEVKQVMR